MSLIRKTGMYASLGLINFAHVVRFTLQSYQKKKPIAGVRILLIDDRRVLLVSHWYAPFVWTLPGGGVNQGESGEEAAIREGWEETGLKANSIAGEIGIYKGRFGARDNVAVYYTGDFSGSLSLTPNMEIMARSWFDIDKLPTEISPGNLRRIEAYRDGVRNERGRW